MRERQSLKSEKSGRHWNGVREVSKGERGGWNSTHRGTARLERPSSVVGAAAFREHAKPGQGGSSRWRRAYFEIETDP